MKNIEKQLCKLIAMLAVIGLPGMALSQSPLTLRNDNIEISFEPSGNLKSLKNIRTGHEYASGRPIWRLYYDTKKEKEIEVITKDNIPSVTREGNQLKISYSSLKSRDNEVKIGLVLYVILEENQVRFVSEVVNNEPHTIVRELHYPLVGNLQLSKGQSLLTTYFGGQLYTDPRKEILEKGNNPPYMAPSQYYRQMDLKYPSGAASNCFAFPAANEGLYFGSHDTTFQDTWHGLRLYPDAKGEFKELEAGLFKYPNCMAGEKWRCDANVIVPYTGSWHETSKIYRNWANTWWKNNSIPQWVKEMKSWQRIIFRHQYGETFFKYTDLGNRIKSVGQSVGADAVFPFGWWESGMDNGNPNYATDPAQGGDAGWKKAIAEYKKGGGKVLLYFNGKLIDKESAYYNTGPGKELVFRDNTGSEITESYRFKGLGTFTGSYNSRTFAVADTRNPKWQKKLIEMADLAIGYGANSVFYDQLGYGESTSNWDLSKEFPVPNMHIIADKARALEMIHDHIDARDKNFAIGTEWFTDVTAQHVDYIHNIYGATGNTSFIDWARYTFPEVIISDREIRDDTDIERRVNHTVLKGLRNDIEIYRCRDLIDQTPRYQKYLAAINQIKDKYKSLLLAGTYQDTDGFAVDNVKIQARSFVNGHKMAVVVTQSTEDQAAGVISVPGYKYLESSVAGEVKLENLGSKGYGVKLNKHGLAVLIYEKSGK